MVLLLGKAAGFTLTLPGIAGLIVAVGITADSFIVYFERIRDEMRDGKSMRVAVEAGWMRARNTCLAADAVSLLAAVVLYIFAAGVVRGFAFALGLSTAHRPRGVLLVHQADGVVAGAVPRSSTSGHKLSGLDAETLGVDKIDRRPVPAATGRSRWEGGPDGQVLAGSATTSTTARGRSTSSAASGSGTPSPASSSARRARPVLKGLNIGIEFVGGAQYTRHAWPTDAGDPGQRRRAARGRRRHRASRAPRRPSSPPPATAAILVQTEQLTTAEQQRGRRRDR